MDCSCVYVDADCWSEPIAIMKRTSLKDHVCGECGAPIKARQLYMHEIMKFEGTLSTCITCLDCLSIRDAMFCDGYFYESLMEYLREHVNDMDGNISEDCLTVLTIKAREKVCQMIEDRWVDMNLDDYDFMNKVLDDDK